MGDDKGKKKGNPVKRLFTWIIVLGILAYGGHFAYAMIVEGKPAGKEC